MKKPKKVTEKELIKIKKEVEKIKQIKNKMEQLKERLTKIQNNHNWLRYLGEDMLETLTKDQRYKLAEYSDIIIYADRD